MATSTVALHSVLADLNHWTVKPLVWPLGAWSHHGITGTDQGVDGVTRMEVCLHRSWRFSAFLFFRRPDGAAVC